MEVPSISIPKITDWNVINKIAVQVHDLHANWRPDVYKKVDAVVEKSELAELIQNKMVYIASIKGIICGYMILKLNEVDNPVLEKKKYLVVDVIGVDEKFRRNGIGTSFLDFATMYAQSLGCTDLQLSVNDSNEAAIQSYEKFGFKVKNIVYSKPIK